MLNIRPSKSFRLLTLLILSVFTIGLTFAGTERTDERPHWRKNLFKRLASDQKYLFTTWVPHEIRRPGFIFPVTTASAVAFSAAGDSSAPDIKISRAIADWGRAHAEGPAQTISTLGDGASGAVFLGGVYLFARIRGNTQLKRTTSLSTEAMLNAGLWNVVLKKASRRSRPNAAYNGQFGLEGPDVENTSFPSGHAMGAFSIATVFASEYRGKRWVPWLAYGSAGLIASSRVTLGRHHVSDVVVGGLLGHSLGRMVIARENGVEKNRVFDRFQPIYEPGRERYGLSYSHSW